MQEKFGLSVRKACRILGVNRTTYLYKPKTKNDEEILKNMKEIVAKHPKAGKWIAIDFVIDSIANKRQLKNLTVIDPVSKVSPKIVPALTMKGENVAEVLEEIWKEEPFTILQTDNGPEFRNSAVQKWCENHQVNQVFSRPGKPTDNCFIESFNRTFRDECLNMNYFSSLSEAKTIIEQWRIDYNENRPQRGLNELTPIQFKNTLMNKKISP